MSETLFAFFPFICVFIVIMMIVCSKKSDEIIEDYDYEFGYVKSFFFMYFLICSIFCIVMCSSFIKESGVTRGTFIGITIGIVLFIIDCIIFFKTLAKSWNKNIIRLFFSMIMVGISAHFRLTFTLLNPFSWLGFLFSASGNTTSSNEDESKHFPERYGRDINGEEHIYYLVEDNGTYAYICDFNDRDYVRIRIEESPTDSYSGADGNVYWALKK